MARKIIGVLLGIFLIIGAFYFSKWLINSKERLNTDIPPVIKSVYTKTVKNGEVPLTISANGNLRAARSVELFAEVQGVLIESTKPFKAGQRYRKGEVLLSLNSQEFYTSLQAQRSALYDQIAAMMPDLKFDYPQAYERWNAYLKAYDINKQVKPLPDPSSEKERFFVTAQKIFTSYYNVKNLEKRLEKHVIYAPFDGILTESLVNAGTLIRTGQKLGEFISTYLFELEVAVNAEYLDILKVGKQVKLTNLGNSKKWTGIVKRVNGRIDQSTQTINVFIEVSGEELIEGMYMVATIFALPIKNAIEVKRNLLLNEKELFIVKNGELHIKEIIPVHNSSQTVIVKGLEDGTQMISRPVAGGYEGMPVKATSDVPKAN